MKGDFTRFTHDPTKHYTGVLKQQGRVGLDADWNEHVAIQQHLEQIEAKDIIGPCGVPKTGGGFGIDGTFLDLWKVYFVDTQIGWAVGEAATILATTNGGVTWKKQSPPAGVTSFLLGVHFVNAQVGWAVGENATILSTTDGGNTWRIQAPPSGVTDLLRDVHFVNLKVGWTVGGNATILATIDGGATWKLQSIPNGVKANLRGVHFYNDKVGWAVGERTTILATTNGGATWKPQQATGVGGYVLLRGVYFVDDRIGWAVGSHATILATKDGGGTWYPQAAPAGQQLSGVHFVNAKVGWVVGNSIILATADGGRTWAAQLAPTEVMTFLYSVHFVNGQVGWAAGFDATMLNTSNGGKTWQRQVVPLQPDDLTISAGRFYVDGLMCELETATSYLKQPDYPSPPALKPAIGRTDLVYLDVWQRHVTAIEDPEIRETALGGPDTATRLQTVCQVKIQTDVGNVRCKDTITGWPPSPSGGRLTNEVISTPTTDNPCLVAPAGGFRGLENRLYRVEIHQGGNLGAATFKWSRDNGSVVFAVEEFISSDPKQLTVKRLGRDQVLTLHVGDWVEVSDDSNDLMESPGTLAKIDAIDEAQRILTLSAPVSGYDVNRHPKVRRWDQTDSGMPKVTAGPIELEDGIQIGFSGSNFKTGDYWVFAARTATGEVERLDNAPPHGIRHHYCKLALVKWNAGSNLEIHDCRPEFPATTELISLFYVSGDGQEAMPDERLPQPLRVGVANGQWPVAKARVKFKIIHGDDGILTAGGNSGVDLPAIETDAKGLAECKWKLGRKLHGQQVEATLLDDADKPVHLPIYFNANLSEAKEVSYNPAGCTKWIDPSKIKTVEDALNALCKREEGCCTVIVRPGEDIQAALDSLPESGGCVCLKAGRHTITKPIWIINKSNIILHGESSGAILERRNGINALNITGLPSTTPNMFKTANIKVEGIQFEISDFADRENEVPAILNLLYCNNIIVENCRILRGKPTADDIFTYGVYAVMSNGVKLIGNYLKDMNYAVSGLSSGGMQIIGNTTVNCINSIVLAGDAGHSLIAENKIWRSPRMDSNKSETVFGITVADPHCTIRENDLDLNDPVYGGIEVSNLEDISYSGDYCCIEKNRFYSKAQIVQDQLPVGIQIAKPKPESETLLQSLPYLQGGIIRGNTFDGNMIAVKADATENLRISDNFFEGTQDKLPELRTALSLSNTVKTVVAGNQIRNAGTGLYSLDGIGNLIRDNQFINGQIGIAFVEEKEAIVSGNRIEEMKMIGIESIPSNPNSSYVDTDMIFVHNRLAWCGSEGFGEEGKLGTGLLIQVRDLTIESCEILNIGQSRLNKPFVGPTISIAAYVQNCRICANKIIGAEGLTANELHRLVLLQGNAITPGDTEILDNTIEGLGSPLVHLFQFHPFSKVIFSNNRCKRISAEATEATVRLAGKYLSVVGNQIKEDASRVPSFNFHKLGYLAAVGNLTSGSWINLPLQIKPTPLEAFNHIDIGL